MLNLSVEDPAALSTICHALSSPLRVEILRLLNQRVLSCLDIGKALGYPLSTISVNVQVLEDAGLILCERLPAKNGTRKMCSLVYSDASIRFAAAALPQNEDKHTVDMPVGNYMGFEVWPSCGLVYPEGPAPEHDRPAAFLETRRVHAQLLWFRRGYVEYLFPLRRPAARLKSLAFSMELCSEAPGFNNRWKSDISLWVNGTHLGAWTCPGDFGDRRGKLTPAFWGTGNTQYGLLTEWQVTAEGSSVNGSHLSAVGLRDLKLDRQDFLRLKIGVEEGAANLGGVNLFGEGFGDYPQSIRMVAAYEGGGPGAPA